MYHESPSLPPNTHRSYNVPRTERECREQDVQYSTVSDAERAQVERDLGRILNAIPLTPRDIVTGRLMAALKEAASLCARLNDGSPCDYGHGPERQCDACIIQVEARHIAYTLQLFYGSLYSLCYPHVNQFADRLAQARIAEASGLLRPDDDEDEDDNDDEDPEPEPEPDAPTLCLTICR